MYPPTKVGLEVSDFIFSFTFLDAALVTKTMYTQIHVPGLLYGNSHPSGDVWTQIPNSLFIKVFEQVDT